MASFPSPVLVDAHVHFYPCFDGWVFRRTGEDHSLLAFHDGEVRMMPLLAREEAVGEITGHAALEEETGCRDG